MFFEIKYINDKNEYYYDIIEVDDINKLFDKVDGNNFVSIIKVDYVYDPIKMLEWIKEYFEDNDSRTEYQDQLLDQINKTLTFYKK